MASGVRKVAACWVIAGGTACLASGDNTQAQATLTAGAIREGLRISQEKIRSISVVTIARNADVPNAYLRSQIVAMAPDLFYRSDAHGSESQHWTDDPFRSSFYMGGQGAITFYPFDRVMSRKGDKHDGSFPPDVEGVFLLATGVWPLPKWRGPDERQLFFPSTTM
jgi:hypothetical protein